MVPYVEKPPICHHEPVIGITTKAPWPHTGLGFEGIEGLGISVMSSSQIVGQQGVAIMVMDTIATIYYINDLIKV